MTHPSSQPAAMIPADDPERDFTLARSDSANLPHIGLVGDTYTILVAGKDTAGRYCLIEMHIPPDGGPPPHRHDFEEMLSVLEGEIEATFRGKKTIIRAGETINIPANAPHQFQNKSGQPARLLCLCSPAGQEEFFKEVGVSGTRWQRRCLNCGHRLNTPSETDPSTANPRIKATEPQDVSEMGKYLCQHQSS